MMKIYPNPTSSMAYVTIPSEMNNGGVITVKNQSGEVIQESTFLENNSQLIPLDLSNQPSGLYNVSLKNDKEELSYDILNLGRMKNLVAV